MGQTDRVDGFKYCQVVTTLPSRDAAEALAESAVLARLAACAQVGGPIASTYWWQGQVDSAEEWTVVFKTTTERYDELQRHILDSHDYDVPEVLATPVLDGNPAYLAWISDELASLE
jgi:periplasmic divalent cation tolerance protein